MTIETKNAGTQSTGTIPSGGSAESGKAGDTAKALRDSAVDMFEDAKEAARSKLGEEKQAATSGIDDVAHALRGVAKGRDDGTADEMLVKLAGSAADGLERLSNGIRNKDAGSMLRDVQSFAREQPVAFFGLTMAAGFLAARFLKASETESGTERTGTTGTATHGANQHHGNGRQEESWTNR